MYAREGMRLLNGALERFVDGETGECEEEMLLGAHFAGTSIESSMLGAAHACANPLSAEYGTAHGVAVGVMLPVVVDYNMRNQAQRYAGLLGDPDLSARLREIRSRLGLPNSLGALNVGSDQIPGLAAAAAEQWTGTFNPEPVDETVCRDLYAAAL